MTYRSLNMKTFTLKPNIKRKCSKLQLATRIETPFVKSLNSVSLHLMWIHVMVAYSIVLQVKVVPAAVNVGNALKIGCAFMASFELGMPDTFRDKIKHTSHQSDILQESQRYRDWKYDMSQSVACTNLNVYKVMGNKYY